MVRKRTKRSASAAAKAESVISPDATAPEATAPEATAPEASSTVDSEAIPTAVVDVVVDRRLIEDENPQPIHPMDVVNQQLGQATGADLQQHLSPPVKQAAKRPNNEQTSGSESAAMAKESDTMVEATTTETDAVKSSLKSAASKKAVSKKAVSKKAVSKKAVSDTTVSETTVSEATVSDKTASVEVPAVRLPSLDGLAVNVIPVEAVVDEERASAVVMPVDGVSAVATKPEPIHTLLVEAIAIAEDRPLDSPLDPESHTVVDELSAAIASVHQHEADLETHLTAIEEQQDQLQQQLDQAQTEIAVLKRQLTDTQNREADLNQQVIGLQQECDRTTVKLNQCHAKLAEQTKRDQELTALKTQVAELTTELADAKAHIASLTQKPPAQDRFAPVPPPLPTPLHRPTGQESRALGGLPPMSTERLSISPTHRDQLDSPVQPPSVRPRQPKISRSSERLPSAYTRPGFANGATEKLPQGRQPMPRLQATPASAVVSSPTANNPANSMTNKGIPQRSVSGINAPGKGGSMVSRRSASSLARRSYDQVQPQHPSSTMPKPKVSDAEIGWFD